MSRRRGRKWKRIGWVLGGLAAAFSVWWLLRADWNPLPFLGAVMGAVGTYYWGPQVLDRVKGLYLPSEFTPEEYVAYTFGINAKSDPIQAMRYMTVEQYTSRALEKKTKESDKFVYFDAFINCFRPYFTPVKGSEEKWYYNKVSPLDLPIWMRLALLPDFACLNDGDTRLWRLLPHMCTLNAGDGPEDYFKAAGEVYVFQPLNEAPDPTDWVAIYPRITYLFNGQKFTFLSNPYTGCVEMHMWDGIKEEGKFSDWMSRPLADGEEMFIKPTPMKPGVYPFVPAPYPAGHVRDGWLFFGEQFLDSLQPGHWLEIDKLTHFLVMGTSGFGKSVFLNQILAGVKYNLHRFDEVLLVDLKGGVELYPYEDMAKEFRVVYQLEVLPELLSDLVKTIEGRLEQMRQQRIRNWPGKKTLLVIDEYAQIQLAPELGKDQRAAKNAMLADLNKISMLGRAAGVLIWAQLQKGTSDVMDSSFRANLGSQVCFKVANKLTAAGMFGSTDELMVDPVKLLKGRFILYDASNGETHYLQSRVVM